MTAIPNRTRVIVKGKEFETTERGSEKGEGGRLWKDLASLSVGDSSSMFIVVRKNRAF